MTSAFKFFLTLVVVVALAVGLGMVFISGSRSSVAVVHPLRGPAVQAVYATGTVEPSVMIPIAAKNAARLISLQVDEGQKVTKGQILGQLDDAELQKALADIQASADLAEKEYERRSQLLAKNAASTQSVDQAFSTLQSARARVQQAQASLGNMVLTAPEDGTIIRRDGEMGQMIAVNQPVFWMAADRGMRVAAEVDEEDIALVMPEQTVAIRADAFPGKIFHGKVTSITPKGDPIARSYRVRIALDKDTPLMIGMTAETNIIVHENQNALLVPTTAVQNNVLWVVKNGGAERRNIEVGAKTPEVTEIEAGLDEQDLVVRDAHQQSTRTDSSFHPYVTLWKVP